MFFGRAKKRRAKKSIELIDHLKVTLWSILSDELKVALLIQGNVHKSKCEEFGQRYAAFVVNRLFGDSNVEIYSGNEELFDKIDKFNSDIIGKVVNHKYPELKPLLTDAVIRYYQAHGNLKTQSRLAPIQATFNKAVSMGLIYSKKDDFKPISDIEYIDTIKKLELKQEENLKLLNERIKHL